MDNLEEFLKEHASEKPLVIDETMLINKKLEMNFKRLEDRLRELTLAGKIRYTHEIFPGSTQKQIIVEWIG